MRGNLILMMSFSGSVLFLCYLLLCLFASRDLTARFRCSLLRAALVFFLFPFPEYKYRVPGPLGELMVSLPATDDRGYAVIENLVQLGSNWEHTVIPATIRADFIVLGFSVAAAAITLLIQLAGYFRAKRFCKKYGAERPSALLEKIKAELRIRQKVTLIFWEDCKTPFSIGYFSPIIAVPPAAEQYDKETWDFVLRHELTHIRSGDLWVKLLGLIAVAVHCFNPVSYFLFFELCRMTEVRCDSLATKNYTKEQKKNYCNFLLDLMTLSDSDKKNRTGMPTVRLVGGGVKEIKGRLLEMQTEKKKRRVLPVLMAAVVALTAWVAAWAYDPAPICEATPGLEPNPDAEIILGVLYEPYDLYGSNTGDTFVDDEGNTYTVSSEANRASCSHNYVAATIAEHELHSDGGCTVTYYRVQRCTKCGDIKNKIYSNETTSKKCPHLT